MLQTLQEPFVNLGQFLNTVDSVTLLQSLGDSKDTQVGGVGQGIVQIVELRMIVAYETVHTLTNHTQTLLNHFLERASDRHDFANRLHRRTNQTAHTGKLREIPAWNLTYHIVEARSHVCRRCGTHLANLVECIA